MKALLLILISFSLCYVSHAELDYSSDKLSDTQHFQVSYTSKLDPIEINNLHTWVIHIEDPNGEGIIDAVVKVDGGMPEHNHGLPTQPQITKNIGGGCYLLEGMKFHMMGWWTINISIEHQGIIDSVTFNLKL